MNARSRTRWALVGATLLLAACGILSPRSPASIRLSSPGAELALGESVVLSAQVLDEDGAVMEGVAVTWSSSQPAVASVAGGLVVGRSPGAAQITASVGEIRQSASIVVYGPFILSITSRVTSAEWDTTTAQYKCEFTLTASADGGRGGASAEWSTGEVEFRLANGAIFPFLLSTTDLLDYFGSSHIFTGETQVANRIAWSNTQFILVYTIRANMPGGTLSSSLVFVDCF